MVNRVTPWYTKGDTVVHYCTQRGGKGQYKKGTVAQWNTEVQSGTQEVAQLNTVQKRARSALPSFLA